MNCSAIIVAFCRFVHSLSTKVRSSVRGDGRVEQSSTRLSAVRWVSRSYSPVRSQCGSIASCRTRIATEIDEQTGVDEVVAVEEESMDPTRRNAELLSDRGTEAGPVSEHVPQPIGDPGSRWLVKRIRVHGSFAFPSIEVPVSTPSLQVPIC